MAVGTTRWAKLLCHRQGTSSIGSVVASSTQPKAANAAEAAMRGAATTKAAPRARRKPSSVQCRRAVPAKPWTK